ncbi:MAG: hypothetical protein RL660_306 [Bacteroidota bacterium]|jgi:hypothetical protein
MTIAAILTQHVDNYSLYTLAAILLSLIAALALKYQKAKFYIMKLFARNKSFAQVVGIMFLLSLAFGLIVGISTLSVVVGLGSAAIFFVIALILLLLDLLKR